MAERPASHVAKAAIVGHTKEPRQKWQAATITHSTRRPSVPRRVALAHAKHSTPEPVHPTLGDRFHALPPELRAHIFSFLLVRPIKWDLRHHDSCPLRSSNIDHWPTLDWLNRGCVRCFRYRDFWKVPGWDNPWRSTWAPEKRNPYMCSDCWDLHFRPPSFPLPRRFERCLCARREGLETLLGCRQWYGEAGHVFYSRNTFAFEDCAMFAGFVLYLPRRWENAISRVSILLAPQSQMSAANRDGDVFSSGWNSRKIMPHMWSYLCRLPCLSYLELDAAFLTRADSVKCMLRLGLRNTRQVNFVQQNHYHTYSTLHGNPLIWPQFHQPMLLVGGVAEEVARAIKGQRRTWLKRRGAVEKATEKETEEQKNRRECSDRLDKKTREFDCHDCGEWKRLWWEGRGADHPAYLASERYVWHSSHWREWRPDVGETSEGKVDRHGACTRTLGGSSSRGLGVEKTQ